MAPSISRYERFAGAEVPKDRPIDSVDQGDFFRGRTEAPVQALGVPRIYNLYTNPHEVLEHNLTTTHLWVMRPISKMIAEYQASLKKYPPIPVGAPDPYEPPAHPSS